MKIFYHADPDGRCSAAIAYRAVRGVDFIREKIINLIEMEYNREIDIDQIGEWEQVYILDLSIKPEILVEIMHKIGKENLIWIDHHMTSLPNKSYPIVRGRVDTRFSACELTWDFFYPWGDFPQAVQLIGDYDTWQFKYKKDTEYFQLALRTYPHGPKDPIWDDLLTSCPNNVTVIDLINQGAICVRMRDQICQDYLNLFGYETKFEGFGAYAVNLSMFASKQFGELYHKYHICIGYVFDGDKYKVSLYSETINVGDIARKYGGGGHFGAAGFICFVLPFLRKDMEVK